VLDRALRFLRDLGGVRLLGDLVVKALVGTLHDGLNVRIHALIIDKLNIVLLDRVTRFG
jgi:hypothetical protein